LRFPADGLGRQLDVPPAHLGRGTLARVQTGDAGRRLHVDVHRAVAQLGVPLPQREQRRGTDARPFYQHGRDEARHFFRRRALRLQAVAEMKGITGPLIAGTNLDQHAAAKTTDIPRRPQLRPELVRFWRVTELIATLLEAQEERQLLRTRGQLAKLDRLILDELGYVPTSRAGAERLFDVIATASERNSMLVTTNLPFEKGQSYSVLS